MGPSTVTGTCSHEAIKIYLKVLLLCILLMVFILFWVRTQSDEKNGKTAFCYFSSEVQPFSKWVHTNLCNTCVPCIWPKYLMAFISQVIKFVLFVKIFVKTLFRKCSKNCSGPKRRVQRSWGRMKLTSRNKSTLIFNF